MKNIQGTIEDLSLFNENGVKVYKYYKSSNGFSWECTYDSNGNELTYKGSTGYSYEYTYDSNGNTLTFKDSDGYSYEYTYDSNGNTLTYKNSDGKSRGFDIPDKRNKETVYWTMRDGNSINVDDMDVKHLRNILKMIIKNKSKVNISKHKIEIHGEIAQDMIDQGYLNEQEDFDPKDFIDFL